MSRSFQLILSLACLSAAGCASLRAEVDVFVGKLRPDPDPEEGPVERVEGVAFHGDAEDFAELSSFASQVEAFCQEVSSCVQKDQAFADLCEAQAPQLAAPTETQLTGVLRRRGEEFRRRATAAAEATAQAREFPRTERLALVASARQVAAAYEELEFARASETPTGKEVAAGWRHFQDAAPRVGPVHGDEAIRQVARAGASEWEEYNEAGATGFFGKTEFVLTGGYLGYHLKSITMDPRAYVQAGVAAASAAVRIAAATQGLPGAGGEQSEGKAPPPPAGRIALKKQRGLIEARVAQQRGALLAKAAALVRGLQVLAAAHGEKALDDAGRKVLAERVADDLFAAGVLEDKTAPRLELLKLFKPKAPSEPSEPEAPSESEESHGGHVFVKGKVALSWETRDAFPGTVAIEHTKPDKKTVRLVVKDTGNTTLTCKDEGDHLLTLRPTDYAGNAGEPVTTSFVVGATPRETPDSQGR